MSKRQPADQPDPLIGTTLGEFEIIELLGRGGMGAVYKARQPSLDRMVALKVLPRAHSEKPAARFEREARAAAAVNHPNIINIHSVGADRGYQYIAMELVEGETLGDILKREGPLAPDRAIEMMKQAASALVQAHKAGILHRDIKPDNMLLTPDGDVKVADFGLAKRPEVDVSMTQAGKALGTPLYMPPEVARGGDFEARSDLYSLGATFYHLLSGRPPFDGGSASEVALKQAENEAPPLADIAPRVPRTLARVIHRLLARDPADRHGGAAKLLEALERIEAGEGVSKPRPADPKKPGAAPPPDTVPVDREGETSKLLMAGIGAAVLVLGIGIAFLLFALGSKDRTSKGEETPPLAQPRSVVPQESPQGPPGPVVVKPQPERPPGPPPKPKPKPKPNPPSWETAWKDAETKAGALVRKERFGEAVKTYEAVAKRFKDAKLQDLARKGISKVRNDADAAYRKLEDRARELLGEKKFDQARTALEPVLDHYGIPAQKQEVQELLAEIGAAAKAKPPPTKPEPKSRPKPKPKRPRQKRPRLDVRWAAATKLVEMKVAAWDFHGAATELAKVKFKDKELTERLATRRDEADRLVKLKGRIIERINKAKPWLQRRSVAVRGPEGVKIKTVGTRVVKADDGGLTVQVTGKDKDETELRTWQSLPSATVQRFVQSAVDPKSPDDQLAAGILALARSDAAAAEKHFDKASSLGAGIDRYLDPLAAAAFARASELLDQKKFAEAAAALTALKKKYANTSWLASHKKDLEQATGLVAGADSEKLYAEAAEFLKKKMLWELKLIVDKLKADYAKTPAVTDTQRKPSFAEMEQAVAGLGKFLTVRKGGKGDFKTIQAAIDAAPPMSLIEIQDDGPYNEKLVIPQEKKGLTVRGKKGCWPIITSSGPRKDIDVVVDVKAPGTTLERLFLLQGAPPVGQNVYCLRVKPPEPPEGAKVRRGQRLRASLRLRCAMVYMHGTGGLAIPSKFGEAIIEESVIAAYTFLHYDCVAKNCLWVAGEIVMGGSSNIRSCTILVWLRGAFGRLRVVDSIVAHTEVHKGGNERMQYCNLFGKPPFHGPGKPGKGCFSSNPQFRDPKNMDYQLKPTSPCRRKASDGGDVGCRFTPEMLEMIERLRELRKKGIIKL